MEGTEARRANRQSNGRETAPLGRPLPAATGAISRRTWGSTACHVSRHIPPSWSHSASAARQRMRPRAASSAAGLPGGDWASRRVYASRASSHRCSFSRRVSLGSMSRCCCA